MVQPWLQLLGTLLLFLIGVNHAAADISGIKHVTQSETSAVISWDSASDECDIEVKPDGASDTIITSETTKTNNRHVWSTNSLQPGTKYKLEIKCGESASKAHVFYTKVNKPFDLKVLTSQTTAHISWKNPDVNPGFVTVIVVEIDSPYGKEIVHQAGSQVVLSNLMPNTLYSATIEVEHSDGESRSTNKAKINFFTQRKPFPLYLSILVVIALLICLVSTAVIIKMVCWPREKAVIDPNIQFIYNKLRMPTPNI